MQTNLKWILTNHTELTSIHHKKRKEKKGPALFFHKKIEINLFIKKIAILLL